MEKGDKIIDNRDNSIHIVNCVDIYETVTLVFTESKKYIPIESVKLITNQINLIKNIFIKSIKVKNEKILSVSEWETKYGHKFK